jgi:predicted CoA-substrate-specific enzyme activase
MTLLTAGVDVGTMMVKVAVLADGKDIVGIRMAKTGPNVDAIAKGLIADILKVKGIDPNAQVHVVSTGAGRKNITGTIDSKTEFVAFARGARAADPKAHMVVDIGGQGLRVMELDDMGVMANFATNDKCSSGTGCFLDAMAFALRLQESEMADLGLKAHKVATVQATCTIFAESECISLVAKGVPKEEILAGLYAMVAKKIIGMVTRMGVKQDIVLAGGVSAYPGVVKAVENELKQKVFVPPNPEALGALGAAHIAAQVVKKKAGGA